MCIHWITKHICKANEHVYSLDNKNICKANNSLDTILKEHVYSLDNTFVKQTHLIFVKQTNMCIHWITKHICKANEHVYSLDNKTHL